MKRKIALIIFALAITLPGAALADEAISPALFTANNIWMMLAAGLVFVMQDYETVWKKEVKEKEPKKSSQFLE